MCLASSHKACYRELAKFEENKELMEKQIRSGHLILYYIHTKDNGIVMESEGQK